MDEVKVRGHQLRRTEDRGGYAVSVDFVIQLDKVTSERTRIRELHVEQHE